MNRKLRRSAEAAAKRTGASPSDPRAADPFAAGLAHHQGGRLAQAETLYRETLALNPDHADALHLLGVIASQVGRHDIAVDLIGRAIAHNRNSSLYYCNLGLALAGLRRFAEAIESYDRALSLGPGGTQPEWSGEDIAGKRLLLHAEQGFGDTIQFARYAAQAAKRGADVVLEVQPPLKPLLGGLFGVEVVAAGHDRLPSFDLHCPLLSLPRLFATTPATIPGDVPYIAAPADRIAAWTPRLPADGVRVGLAWSGHPDNARDHERSIPFARLASLTGVAGARFVSLQKDIRAADADDFRRCGKVVDLSRELRDFADTAAVIAQLDLVITVDTAVAHLAGAMGKPVWVLLPRIPDFRWLLDRATSPWYPSARLFRKGQMEAWDAVIASVAMELAARAASTVARGRSAQPDETHP